MSLYLRILSYIKPYLPRLIAAAICTVLAAAGNLYVPWIIKDVIDSVLAEKNAEMLNIIAAGIIIIFFISKRLPGWLNHDIIIKTEWFKEYLPVINPVEILCLR